MPDKLQETCKCGATLYLTGDFLHLAVAAQEWRGTHNCNQEDDDA